tara:strand:- start:471 stop:956 length:486 start_codon:yes stop_codon:yes gene_type:complete
VKIKIHISKDGKEYFADGDKVFNWLYERYEKNRDREKKSKIVPYKTRLENFFNEASVDTEWITELTKAFPGIDVVQELQKAKTWLVSNNTHRKDLRKFCYNWIAKAKPIATDHHRTSYKLDSTGSAYIGYCPCGKSDFYDKYEIKGAYSKCCSKPIQPTRG